MAADLSSLVLAEPDVAVRSGGNADRAAFARGDIDRYSTIASKPRPKRSTLAYDHFPPQQNR
jgi:hypothetical protein